MSKFDVSTHADVTGRIHQVVDYIDNLGKRHNVYHMVIDTADHQVREALIKLGWTPPQK